MRGVGTRHYFFGGPSARVVVATALWLVLLTVGLLMVLRTSTAGYSPDSWSLVDIARGITDPTRQFGSVFGVRDFLNRPGYNDSFPLLWPALLAPGIEVFGPSKPVGGYFFVAIWLLSVSVVHVIFRLLKLPAIFSPAFGLGLLAIPGYVDEGHAGRTVPLAVLLALSATYLVVRLALRGGQASLLTLLGLNLSLMVATRFDALPLGPLMIITLLALGVITVRNAIWVFSFWLTVPALWVLYSLGIHGVIFASDNGSSIFSPENRAVTDWPLESGTESGLIDQAFLWLVKLSGNAARLPGFIVESYSWWLLAIGFSIGLGLLLKTFSSVRDRVYKDTSPGPSQNRVKIGQVVTLLGFVMISVKLLLILLTGFYESRYLAEGAALLLLASLLNFGKSIVERFQSGLIHMQTFLGIVPQLVFSALLLSGGIFEVVSEYVIEADQAIADQALVDCLKGEGGVPIITGHEAYRIPATTEIRAVTEPGNYKKLSESDWQNLMKTYGVTSWLDTDGEKPLPDNAAAVLVQSSCKKY